MSPLLGIRTSATVNPLYASPTFGNPGGKREFISYEARALLVEHVLKLATLIEVQEALRKLGISRSISGVSIWMGQTRRWLGLPPVYPSITSGKYQDVVLRWIAENGFPTKQQIMSGWLPDSKMSPQPSS